jgi:hypothetical protein
MKKLIEFYGHTKQQVGNANDFVFVVMILSSLMVGIIAKPANWKVVN